MGKQDGKAEVKRRQEEERSEKRKSQKKEMQARESHETPCFSNVLWLRRVDK